MAYPSKIGMYWSTAGRSSALVPASTKHRPHPSYFSVLEQSWATVSSKATHMQHQCVCGQSVDYTVHVIRDVLLNGLSNPDILRKTRRWPATHSHHLACPQCHRSNPISIGLYHHPPASLHPGQTGRSGGGKVVSQFYDKCSEIWGGSPAMKL